MKRIIAVEDQLRQGQTKPLLCLGEDGERYVVKCSRAGRKALIAEWLAANLASAFNIPVPSFTLLEADPAIAALSQVEGAETLSKYPAFGSRYVQQANELCVGDVKSVPRDIQARVLLFDWWIGNGDRTLTVDGGNPNLLWVAHRTELVVIDHNLAFDPDESFWDQHVFRNAKGEWTPAFRGDAERRMDDAVGRLSSIWADMPEEWTEYEAGLSLNTVQDLLLKYKTQPDTFWSLDD